MKAKLTRKLFVETIEKLKEQYEYDKKCGDALELVFAEANFIRYDNSMVTNQLLKILKTWMDDDHADSWIDYYVYELDFGATYKEGCANYEDGTNINLSNPECLYNFLKKEMKTKKDKHV